ncbi:hypothetical protein ABZ847_07215 [Streptomyces bauhiniae]
MRDGSGLGWGAVFPEGSSKSATYLRRADSADSVADARVFEDALADGAFALGGITMAVEVNAAERHVVVITDVRPISVRKPVASGALFYLGTQGNTPRGVSFRLDDVKPVAKAWDPVSGKLGADFFRVQRIALPPAGNGETLIMNFRASAAAYEFNVAFDYTVDGHQYTQYLTTENGKPRVFRATAPRCGMPGIKRPYTELRAVDMSSNPPRYKPVSSSTFCSWQKP